MESLDLVSGTGEEARTWITGLKYLMAGISDEDSLAKRQRTRDQYPFLWSSHPRNSINAIYLTIRKQEHVRTFRRVRFPVEETPSKLLNKLLII